MIFGGLDDQPTPREWELAAFSSGDVAAVDDYASVAEHVQQCDTCSESVEWFRQTWALFRDVQVHEAADQRAPAPQHKRIAEARNIVQRAVAENEAAEVTFGDLRQRPLED